MNVSLWRELSDNSRVRQGLFNNHRVPANSRKGFAAVESYCHRHFDMIMMPNASQSLCGRYFGVRGFQSSAALVCGAALTNGRFNFGVTKPGLRHEEELGNGRRYTSAPVEHPSHHFMWVLCNEYPFCKGVCQAGLARRA